MIPYRMHYQLAGEPKVTHWTDPQSVSIAANLAYADGHDPPLTDVEIEFVTAEGIRVSRSEIERTMPRGGK